MLFNYMFLQVATYKNFWKSFLAELELFNYTISCFPLESSHGGYLGDPLGGGGWGPFDYSQSM